MDIIKLHIAFIFIRIADILSTYINVNKYGFIVEGNWLPRMLMSRYGFGIFSIINIITVSLIWWAFSRFANHNHIKFALSLFLAINTLIILNNLVLYILV